MDAKSVRLALVRAMANLDTVMAFNFVAHDFCSLAYTAAYITKSISKVKG
jgi:hypothetical protein